MFGYVRLTGGISSKKSGKRCEVAAHGEHWQRKGKRNNQPSFARVGVASSELQHPRPNIPMRKWAMGFFGNTCGMK